MNITKDIINDLIPLYATNECSADTRTLIEDYLRQNPAHAAELRQIMNTALPKITASAASLDEMKSLRQARRRVRGRAWLMAFAIFFSLCPFSVQHMDGRTHWLFLESPLSAAAYGCVGLAFCSAWYIARKRSQIL
jgi:hypothetical protein